MLRDSLYNDEHFWKTMEFIDKLDKEIPFKDLFGHFDLSSLELEQLTLFLESFGYAVKRCNKTGRKMLYPPTGKGYGLEQLDDEVPSYELFKTRGKPPVKVTEYEAITRLNPTLKLMDEWIDTSSPMMLKLGSGEKVEVLGHKITFMGNDLYLICEKIKDKQIESYEIQTLLGVMKGESKNIKANFSQRDIEEFITAMRTLDSKEERLVIKIFGDELIELNPKYQFFRKAYSTPNMDGQRVFAAYVEINEPLFEWLLSIQKQIEIIDPSSTKWGLLKYCERKLRESNLKKAG